MSCPLYFVIDLRKRNFIQPNEFPYNSPGTLTYDSGDYEATLNSALKSINYDDFNKRKDESKANGKLRGLGISCYIEACGVAPSKLTLEAGGRGGYYESSTVRINPTGSDTYEVLLEIDKDTLSYLLRQARSVA